MSKYRTFNKITVREIMESGAYIATFKERGFIIQGDQAVHKETGKTVSIDNIYSEIRNIQNKKKEIIAKRKNLGDDLVKVIRIN